MCSLGESCSFAALMNSVTVRQPPDYNWSSLLKGTGGTNLCVSEKKRYRHPFSTDPIMTFLLPMFVSPSSRRCPTQMTCFQKTKERHYRHSSSRSMRLCDYWSCLLSPFEAQPSLWSSQFIHSFCTCHPSSSEVKLWSDCQRCGLRKSQVCSGMLGKPQIPK